MNAGHPTEVQLVDWMAADRPDGSVARHVRDCPSCAGLTLSTVPGWSATAEPELGAEVGEVPRPASPDPDPARGQVWRLAWDDATTLAVIWNVFEDYLDVMPVTPDVAMADDATVLLQPEVTGGLGPTAIWVGLEAPVDWCVLDVCWGELPSHGIDAVRHRVRLEKPVDMLDVSVGPRLVDVFDERYEYRAILDDTMHQLAKAAWTTESASGTLDDLGSAAGVPLDAILAAISAPPTERLRVKRGQRPLTRSEAELLVPLLGVDLGTILATNPPIPAQLVAALGRPQWRSALRRAAREAHVDEADARRRAAYAVMGLAARQTTFEDTEAQWHERLKHHFAA